MKRILVALGITSLAVLTSQAAPGSATAVVKRVSGTAWKSAAGGVPQPITQGAVVKTGDTLTTGLDSTVEVQLGSESQTVTLAGNSVLRVEQLKGDTAPSSEAMSGRLQLIRGAMQASASSLAQGSRFEVKMPNGSVTALAEKTDAEWSALYDARNGNVYNLASTESGLPLAGSVMTSGTSSKQQQVTVSAGQRFVMPAGLDESFETPLASAVSTIPNTFSAANALASVDSGTELADGNLGNNRRSSLAPAVTPTRKPRSR